MIIKWHWLKAFVGKYKHGIEFSEAAECIFSTVAMALPTHGGATEDEQRFQLITISPLGRVLSIVFTKRQNGIETRLISVRSASRKERKRYFEKFGDDVQFRGLQHNQPLVLEIIPIKIFKR